MADDPKAETPPADPASTSETTPPASTEPVEKKEAVPPRTERKVDLSGLEGQLKSETKRAETAEAKNKKTEADGARSRDRARSMEALAISQLAMRELEKQGADPALSDLAAASLDLDGIEVVDGRIQGVADSVKKLLKERPELMGTVKSTSPGVIDGAPGGSKTEVSDPLTYDRDQLAAMTDKEWDAFADSNPKVTFQLGDGPPITCNISSIPNAAFGMVRAAQARHKEVTQKLTGGG